MAHGYLGDGYGTHGDTEFGRDEDRERWRDRDPDWRNRDRDRGAMFQGREGYGREHGFGGFHGDYGRSGQGQGGFGGRGDWQEGRHSFSANPDDHYRNWRDRHMSELDRDYEEYCREREQQFHRDFDDWRRQRYGNPQPLQPGMTQSGLSMDPTGMTQAERAGENGDIAPDAEDTATLGSTSSGRRRR
jgi:hypothetical protein